jgi:hypothetical protein
MSDATNLDMIDEQLDAELTVAQYVLLVNNTSADRRRVLIFGMLGIVFSLLTLNSYSDRESVVMKAGDVEPSLRIPAINKQIAQSYGLAEAHSSKLIECRNNKLHYAHTSTGYSITLKIPLSETQFFPFQPYVACDAADLKQRIENIEAKMIADKDVFEVQKNTIITYVFFSLTMLFVLLTMLIYDMKKMAVEEMRRMFVRGEQS